MNISPAQARELERRTRGFTDEAQFPISQDNCGMLRVEIYNVIAFIEPDGASCATNLAGQPLGMRSHTQDCEDHAFCHHAATGGDADCICGADKQAAA